jgi:hypothetical protein
LEFLAKSVDHPKAPSLNVPPSLLTRADEVIE